MKQIKRFLSLLLVLCLMASMIPVTARAATSGTCGENVTWTLSDDGVLTISGTGPMRDYSWSYGWDSSPFYSTSITSSIKYVILEEGVTSIGTFAFQCCSNLVSVTIPSSVSSIGNGAFTGCKSLVGFYVNTNNSHYSNDSYGVLFDKAQTELIRAPEGYLGYYSIPNSVNSIHNDALGGCSRLTGVTIPNSVVSIGEGAFYDCDSLTSITIPDSVTSIDEYAFEECDSLISITIPNSITSIRDDTFAYCYSLTSVTIPDSVTSIGDGAFANCSSLTSVTIPNSVTSIGDEAFFDCTSLDGIYVDEDNTNYSSDSYGLLFDKNKTILIQTPGGYQGHYTIPDSVTAIDRSAFSNCTKLTSIIIPSSVTSIGYFAFAWCDSLTSVTIPDSVTSIGDCAFNWCDSLTEIFFRGSVPSIASRTFYDVVATAYYPANNPSWTSDVMRDYGGNITWVPYNPGETPGGTTEPKVEAHDTLAELTEVDYLMFSMLAYRDLSGALGDPDKNTNPKTIKEFYSSKWSRKIPTSDGDLGALDVTYAQAFGGIANWYPTAIRTGVFNGFSATMFCNDSGECVIAYCGSKPLTDVITIAGTLLPGTDAFFDWIVNDLQMQILDVLGPQVDPALSVYKSINNSIPSSKIAVTGHSLGGGLANIVSAYSGCKAVTFNAISSLDTAYNELPGPMGKEFEGVNKWNITDHTNEYDILAGMYEKIIVESEVEGYHALKPYKAHKSLNGKGSLFANHGMKSFLTMDSSGSLALTETVGKFIRSTVHTQSCGTTLLNLGTSSDDLILTGFSAESPMRIYGGNGKDMIVASSKNDFIIGGDGNDHLSGQRGHDQYLYYKGDGVDTIYDIGGDDKLYLYGFGSSDTITLYEASGSDHIEIRCNGETIVNILTQNREYSLATLNFFNVHVEKGSKTETINITEYFKTTKYGSRILVACPVDVEVLDADGAVVYTLYDGEVGSYYTDYGTFHVYEEENGEYGKVLDLVEGYTVRIVGVDEGTMDVTYQIPVDGELSVPVSLTDIPVSEDMTAVIEAVDESEVYLVTDEETMQMEHIHSWDSGIVTEQATCTEDGVRTFTCATCGETRTEVIEAWGHNYVTEVTEPTCTEQGYTTVICYGCNDSTVSDYTEALGHNYEDGYCSACGDLTVSAPVAKGSNKASTGKPVVTWEPVEGAVKYEVYRSTKKTGSYSRKSTTTGTSYTNTGAVAGKYYYYFVRAIDADGNYADSNIVGRTCDLAQTTVTLSNVASTGKIKISWKAVEGATKYEVYRATSKNGTYSRISTTANTSVTNTKAEAGKTYYYKVRAICDVDAAAAAYSAVKSRTCDLARPEVTLSNVASSGKIKVSWKTIDGAVKYEVYRATSKTGTYKLVKTTTGTSFTNTSTTAGKTYYYKVKAIASKSSADSAYSEVKSRTCDLPRPDVSIALSSKKPKVSWDKVTGAVEYKVYRATSKTGTYSLVKTTTASYYKDTKATSGKTYYYKVVAVCSNTAGNSAYSSVVSIKATK